MFTQDSNTNKGYCILPDTYLVIFSVPYHPGYLVIWTTPPRYHPLWSDDLYLSGTNVCFTTQGRIFCFTNPYFLRIRTDHLRRIIYQNL